MSTELTNLSDLSPERKSELSFALGLLLENPDEAKSIAAVHGFEESDLLATLCTDTGLRIALASQDKLRQSGELLKRKTLPALNKLVDRINAAIDSDEISVGALPKFSDSLMRLSGLVEQRAAALRRESPPDNLPALNVLMGGEEIPQAKPGQHQINIILPNARREQMRVINPEGA